MENNTFNNEQQDKMIEFSIQMTQLCSDMQYLKTSVETLSQQVSEMRMEDKVKVSEFKDLEVRVRDIELAPYATKADISSLHEELNELKLKPAKNYDQIKTVIVTAVITLLISFISVQLGLK